MALELEAAPRYVLEHHITRDDDEEAQFVFRRNGKRFCIMVSPSRFVNSPLSTEKYLTYLNVLRSDDVVLGDVYETDVYEWIMNPFQTLLLSLAPEPSGQPKDITLKDYPFPEYFVFELDIVNEKQYPRQIFPTNEPHMASTLRFDDDFLDDLETWTVFYDPVGIILSFPNPEDALFDDPRKVLIENKQTECFLKRCYSGVHAKQELKTYKMIHAASLDSQHRLPHLYGIVMDDGDFIIGLLLTY